MKTVVTKGCSHGRLGQKGTSTSACTCTCTCKHKRKYANAHARAKTRVFTRCYVAMCSWEGKHDTLGLRKVEGSDKCKSRRTCDGMKHINMTKRYIWTSKNLSIILSIGKNLSFEWKGEGFKCCGGDLKYIYEHMFIHWITHTHTHLYILVGMFGVKT
mgnify:CR=1 FL=1